MQKIENVADDGLAPAPFSQGLLQSIKACPAGRLHDDRFQVQDGGPRSKLRDRIANGRKAGRLVVPVTREKFDVFPFHKSD